MYQYIISNILIAISFFRLFFINLIKPLRNKKGRIFVSCCKTYFVTALTASKQKNLYWIIYDVHATLHTSLWYWNMCINLILFFVSFLGKFFSLFLSSMWQIRTFTFESIRKNVACPEMVRSKTSWIRWLSSVTSHFEM